MANIIMSIGRMNQFILILSFCILGLGADQTVNHLIPEGDYIRSNAIVLEDLSENEFNGDQNVVILVDVGINQTLKSSLQNAYAKQNVTLYLIYTQNGLSEGMTPEIEYLVVGVAEYIAELIKNIYQSNANKINNLEVVCHGVGCHAVGIAGKRLNQKNVDTDKDIKISTIIALDPTGLEYEEIDTEEKLQPKDADKVIVFHTNAAFAGHLDKLGTLDLYLNGGLYQPSCQSNQKDINVCSHEYAYEYYADLLNGSNLNMIVYKSAKFEEAKMVKELPHHEQLSHLDQLLTKIGSYVVKTTPEPYKLDEILTLPTYYANALHTYASTSCSRSIDSLNPCENIDIELFTHKYQEKPRQIKKNEIDKLGDDYFNETWPTMIIIHGFLSGLTEPTDLGKFYAKELFGLAPEPRKNINLISINWKYGAHFPYLIAHKLVKCVGQYAGEFIFNAINANKMELSDVQVVGHSLGAHAAGWAARTVQDLSGHSVKLPKVIGLDPAGPYFRSTSKGLRMLPTDADEVIIIHTNSRPFPYHTCEGFWALLGTVDLFMNGGMLQPYMENIYSHLDANTKFATIMNMERPIVGYKFHFKDVDHFWLLERQRLTLMQKNECVSSNSVKIFGNATHPKLKKGDAIYVNTKSDENNPTIPGTVLCSPKH